MPLEIAEQARDIGVGSPCNIDLQTAADLVRLLRYERLDAVHSA